ncbi:hypothetical protein NC651_035456 [Populus alba x Populus x berolinensis]|nr:hypothetical protein NC651_035456 [Populus alba x Populus x berolinensis]
MTQQPPKAPSPNHFVPITIQPSHLATDPISSCHSPLNSNLNHPAINGSPPLKPINTQRNQIIAVLFWDSPSNTNNLANEFKYHISIKFPS